MLADPRRPRGERRHPCLPLPGADHEESGGRREGRRGGNGRGLQGTLGSAPTAGGRASGCFWGDNKRPWKAVPEAAGVRWVALTDDAQHVPGAPGARDRAPAQLRSPPRPAPRTRARRPRPSARPHPSLPLLCGSCRAGCGGENRRPRAAASGESAAGPGPGWASCRGRAGGGGREGRCGVRGCGRLHRGPPFATHGVPTGVPAALGLAGAGRPRTVSWRGVATLRPQSSRQAASGVGSFLP